MAIKKREKTSAELGAEGGRARAKRLTGEQRSQIARQAAESRWESAGRDLLRAEFEGELSIGDSKLWCAVLTDGTRVVSRQQFIQALGWTGKVKGGRKNEPDFDEEFKIPVFVGASNLRPFITKELVKNSVPVYYRGDGGPNWGLRAEVLPAACQVFLDAKSAGVLHKMQEHIAHKSRILMGAFATVGVFALIDEATGAQDFRARDALAKILQAFIAKELRKWVKAFPIEFFKGLCRLRKVPFNEAFQFPSYFGHLINDLIYARLAPFVLQELQRKNPVMPNGRRKSKLFQWLSEDIGDPKLRAHLIKVVTLMDASDDWEGFYQLLNRVVPRFSKQPLLALVEESLPEGAVR